MSEEFQSAMNFILVILIVAVLLASVRLFRGPSIADRVIALDLVVAAGVSLLAILALAFHHVVFLDVAIVLALVSFVATVAFALFLEKRAKGEQ